MKLRMWITKMMIIVDNSRRLTSLSRLQGPQLCLANLPRQLEETFHPNFWPFDQESLAWIPILIIYLNIFRSCEYKAPFENTVEYFCGMVSMTES
jgi:hypothetical protein